MPCGVCLRCPVWLHRSNDGGTDCNGFDTGLAATSSWRGTQTKTRRRQQQLALTRGRTFPVPSSREQLQGGVHGLCHLDRLRGVVPLPAESKEHDQGGDRSLCFPVCHCSCRRRLRAQETRHAGAGRQGGEAWRHPRLLKKQRHTTKKKKMPHEKLCEVRVRSSTAWSRPRRGMMES